MKVGKKQGARSRVHSALPVAHHALQLEKIEVSPFRVTLYTEEAGM